MQRELEAFDFEDEEVAEKSSETELEPALPTASPAADGEMSRGAFDSSSESDGEITDDEASSTSSAELEKRKRQTHGILSASEALARGLTALDVNDTEEEEEFIAPGEDDLSYMTPTKWTRVMKRQFKDHKRSYYRSKMDYSNITKDQLKDQALGYVRAIQWNLHYYYHGCASWSWYYPHHYAPYLSDIAKHAHEYEHEFDPSTPFLPFQQLLAVLPAASRHCLPEPYQVHLRLHCS